MGAGMASSSLCCIYTVYFTPLKTRNQQVMLCFTSLSALRLIDKETGSIETGKWADMIVLNHNLLEIPVTDIHKTEVQQTLFKGEIVYEAR
ncbi:MAG: amidohydrolase family protein [Halioglobus sp.]